MGTAGARWIPPHIDLASFPQPDVSSCWSGEQQGRLSLCCSRVSRTPCLSQAHFPGSSGWDVSPGVPRSARAAGSGTGHPLHPGSRLPCSPIRSSPPLSQALSCSHGGKRALEQRSSVLSSMSPNTIRLCFAHRETEAGSPKPTPDHPIFRKRSPVRPPSPASG